MLKSPFYFKDEYLVSENTNKKTKLKRVNVGKPKQLLDTIITDVCGFVYIVFEGYANPIQLRIKAEQIEEFKKWFSENYGKK